MLRRPARLLIVAGVALLFILIFGRAISDLYTEYLWFSGLGYTSTFWTRMRMILLVRFVTGVLGGLLVLLNLGFVARQLGPVHLRRRYGNLEIAEQVPRSYVSAGIVLTAILAGWWLTGLTFSGDSPLGVLAWLRRPAWGLEDPLFGRDLSFFVFSLPVYTRLIDYFLLVIVWCVLLALVGYVLVGAVRWRSNRLEIDATPRLHFAVLIAALIFVMGVRYWLGRYGILLHGSGFADSVGYADVHARLPAQRVLAVLCLASALALLYGARRGIWWPPLAAVGLLIAGSVVLGLIYPSIVQKLQVEPNELAKEEPYIRWNIDFTRRAYGLDGIERRPFPYRRARIGDWDALAPRIERLPLWDPAPLQTTFNETQSLVDYYRFPSVSYDRYGTPGAEQQVAVGVREFTAEGLRPEVRTWRTLHLNPDQVRGIGAVVVVASEKTALGDPVFWVRDVDPVERSPAAPPQLELTEPSVFFGETMTDYLVLGGTADEVSRERTDSLRHHAGVPLASFLRTLAFAWRFGDKNLLFASELTDSSRIVFRRRVGDRVAKLAPFLLWDREPYPVIWHGHIVWMIDGYSMSSTYPIARPQRIADVGTVRYLRNSVKATVDAVSGRISFYAVDEGEPILQAFRRIFPDLIQPLSKMPADLVQHLRYPEMYMRLQAEVLEKYHLGRPDAFFAGQNDWQVPDEPGGATGTVPYHPIYMLMQPPGSPRVEFVLASPFIARGRQNITALLIVRNDAAAYGQKLLIELPRDEQVTGPRQVHTIIEQDPVISTQLSLWRQQGSDVEFGRMRVVPLDSTILFVQPVFLSAAGNSIPQLQRVIVSDGAAVSMAATLPGALNGLYAASGSLRGEAETRTLPEAPAGAWPHEALEIMKRAEAALKQGDFAAFGRHWSELHDLLQRLAQQPQAR